VPDPQSEETFARSRLNHDLREQGQHRLLYDLHRELIRLRNTLPALANLDKKQLEAQSFAPQSVLLVHRQHDDGAALTLLNFGSEPATLDLNVPAGTWEKLLDTADERWQLSSSGAATALPERLESRGTVALTLAPQTCALFRRST
jgi:maltooligosyltrehalose trehalohydrolase